MEWYIEQVLRILFMTLALAAVVTWRNLGFVEDFPARWIHAWQASILVSLPLGLVIGRIAHKIVRWTGARFEEQNPIKKLRDSKFFVALFDAFRLPPC